MKLHDEDLAERKALILAAAEKVFAECGYAQTTMEAVAERAGISKGSIYNYFQNKNDLFECLFVRAFSDYYEKQVLAIFEMPCPVSRRIEKIIDFWFGRMGEYQHISRLVLEFWSNAARHQEAGGLSETLRQVYQKWRSKLAALLDEGVQTGEFRRINPQVAASLFLAILDGIGVQSLLDVGLVIDSQFIDGLKRAILAALTGQAPSPPQT